ncbi:hypothetical protein ACKWTF_001543 [Chironomus riparius]
MFIFVNPAQTNPTQSSFETNNHINSNSKDELQLVASEQKGFLSFIFKIKMPIVTTALSCELEYGTRIFAWFQFVTNCFVALLHLMFLMLENEQFYRCLHFVMGDSMSEFFFLNSIFCKYFLN